MCASDGVIELILHLPPVDVPLEQVELVILACLQYTVLHCDLARFDKAVKALKRGLWSVPASKEDSAHECVTMLLIRTLDGKLPAEESFAACEWLGVGRLDMAPLVARTLAEASSSAF